jgi:hypothetical protein
VKGQCASFCVTVPRSLLSVAADAVCTIFAARAGATMTCTIDTRNRDAFCNWKVGVSVHLLACSVARPSGLSGAKTMAYTYDADGNRRQWGLRTTLNPVSILARRKRRLWGWRRGRLASSFSVRSAPANCDWHKRV